MDRKRRNRKNQNGGANIQSLKSESIPSTSSCVSESSLLQREIALLKRENELLRREQELMRGTLIPATLTGNERASTQLQSTSGCSFRMSLLEASGIIPDFYGGTSQGKLSAQQWSKAVEDLREVYGWDDKATLLYAVSQLRGAAKLWREGQTFGNWEEFKAKILQAFPSAIDEFSVHAELMSRRRARSEEIETYFYEMVAIAKRGNLSEASVINYIISGLGERELMNVLVAANCENLPDLLTQIKKYQNICAQQRYREYYKTQNSKKMCDEVDQPQSKRIKFVENVVHSTRNDGTFRRGNYKHELIPKRVPLIVCFKCGKNGHKANQCPQISSGSSRNTMGYFKDTEGHQKAGGRINMIKEKNLYNKIVKLDGIPLLAFLDLGSCFTTIRLKDAQPFKNSFEESNTSLLGFGGGGCRAVAQFQKTLRIDGVELNVDVMVVPNSSQVTPMIVGQNFFDAEGMVVRKSNGILEIYRNTSAVTGKHSQEQKSSQDNKVRMVTAVQRKIEYSDVNVGEGLSKRSIKKLIDMLNQYRGAIALNINELGSTNLQEMTINLKSSEIVRYKPYRVPYGQQEELRNIIDNLLANDIIEPSISEYSSPVVLVKKKDGSLRMCVDYRKVNALTQRENFPTPNIEEQLNSLNGKTVFTTMDLMSGYYQVSIAESSRHITSFVTPEGQYQFKRVPFGLTNAPAVFMRLMSTITRQMKTKDINMYIDDILLSSIDVESHFCVIEDLLQSLLQAGLTLNLEKCTFFATSASYLGHEITKDGISPGSNKVKAVKDFPTPSTLKGVRQFLGLSGYFRRFVPEYARIATPLNRLLRKDAKLKWTNDEESAFSKLKTILCSEPVLALYDPTANHELHTDACSIGIAAVLIQGGATNYRNPVSYFSRACSEQESKWHSYELEALAVVEGLERFKYYLINKKFTVVTDCNSLKLSHAKRDLIPKLARWWLKIQEFDFDLIYKSGREMAHADALSRQPVEKPNECEVVGQNIMAIGMQEEDWISTLQTQDPELREIRDILEGNIIPNKEKENFANQFTVKGRRVYRKTEDGPRFFVPRGVRWRVIKSAHDDLGHGGSERTITNLKQSYWFPRMRKTVQKYINSCIECLYNKRGKDESRFHLHPIEKICIPFHTVHVDHVGSFPRSKQQNCYLFGVIDAFTKFIILRPTRSTDAKSVIKTMVDMSQYFGMPSRIISDRGSAFTSKIFKTFCEDNGITHVVVAVRTPRANGQIERYFWTVNSAIATMTTDINGRDWDTHVNAVQWGINNLQHRITGKSPHELLFAFKPRNIIGNKLAFALQEELEEETITEPIEELRRKASERITVLQSREAETYNKSHREPQRYKEGDLVLLLAEHPATGQSRKLLPRYKGPYQVEEVLPNDRYKIADTATTRVTNKPFQSIYAADKIRPWCKLDDIAVNEVSSDEEVIDHCEIDASKDVA